MKVSETVLANVVVRLSHSLLLGGKQEDAFASCPFEKLDAAFLITEKGSNFLGRVSSSSNSPLRNNFFFVKGITI